MHCFPQLMQRGLTLRRSTVCQLAARPTQRGVASISRDLCTGLHLAFIQKDVAHSTQRDVAHTGVQLEVVIVQCGFGRSEDRDGSAGAP